MRYKFDAYLDAERSGRWTIGILIGILMDDRHTAGISLDPLVGPVNGRRYHFKHNGAPMPALQA